MTEFEKEEKPFKEPIDGVLYAAACGIKNKGQIEKSEKPSEGLEEEINRLSKNEYFDFTDWKAIARHFAQWGAEHLKK